MAAQAGVFSSSRTGVFSSCCLALDSSSSFPCPAFRAIAKSDSTRLQERHPSMSEMEEGMETIVKTFHKHAGKEGDPDTLNQKEFKQLVNKDMPNTFKKEKKDPRAMNHMMEDLDTDKDEQLCFDEFVAMLVKDSTRLQERHPSMSEMEEGMETIVKTFHKHAGKEGDPDTLNQKEFKQLVNKDMPNTFKKEKKDPRAMNHMMEDLDTDKDEQLCFDEFVAMLVKDSTRLQERHPSMSEMEEGMETIVKTFHKHAGKEGDPDTLNQKEFKQLVNKDMPNTFKKEKKDPRAMNHMMEDLDTDKDEQLCFDEFVAMLVKDSTRLQERHPSMSEMEEGMETIVKTFHKHAGKEGDPDTLNQKEFKQLVNKDMPNTFK
ncbi:hypothetical protein STEG23_018161, partial [Scotinomys teguina]